MVFLVREEARNITFRAPIALIHLAIRPNHILRETIGDLAWSIRLQTVTPSTNAAAIHTLSSNFMQLLLHTKS
jgi:hypothetical protein